MRLPTRRRRLTVRPWKVTKSGKSVLQFNACTGARAIAVRRRRKGYHASIRYAAFLADLKCRGHPPSANASLRENEPPGEWDR
jgi:hypothetical protein